MLTIRNLHARVEDKEILRGIDLQINPGEVHAIMGPNGSGKSTLAGVLAGRDLYDVTEGEVLFQGKNLLDMDPEERAREGIFLAFQYPVEIPGVSNTYFLRAAVNAVRTVADGVNLLRNRERGILVITHYQRLLNYIVPDKVHVLHAGRIVKSGGKELALELESKGYGWVEEEAAAGTA